MQKNNSHLGKCLIVCKFLVDFKILYLCIVLSFLYACNDNGPTDPCIDCPIDFRVTDFEPAWSPDGNTIAYVHGDTIPSKTGIYLINPDGTNNRIWYASISAYSPSWSPNGKWITFSDNAQIYKRKLDGDSVTQLTFEGRNFFPDWSPDGQWIVYDSNLDDTKYDIWIMKSDGTENKNISGESDSSDQGGWRLPDWSPDGNHIVHSRYISGVDGKEIFRMDTSGKNPVRLTFNNLDDSYPVYSPDGTKIAFTSYPQGLASQTQIWVIDTSGSNLNQLTTTQGYTCDWSPDGEWIVYTDSRASSGRLWIMRKDGSNKHQLTFD